MKDGMRTEHDAKAERNHMGHAPNNFRLRISADMAGVAMMAFSPTMTCGMHLTPL